MVFCAVIGLATVSHALSAKAATPSATADGQFNCFDLFKFGSVTVNLTGSTQSASAGTDFTVKAHIVNQNAYPVVNGSVYVKVYKMQTNAASAMANGNNLVDESYVLNDINLAANGSADKTFVWKVPSRPSWRPAKPISWACHSRTMSIARQCASRYRALRAASPSTRTA